MARICTLAAVRLSVSDWRIGEAVTSEVAGMPALFFRGKGPHLFPYLFRARETMPHSRNVRAGQILTQTPVRLRDSPPHRYLSVQDLVSLRISRDCEGAFF